MERIKKTVSIFFRIAISIIVLIFVFRQVDKQSLFEIIRNANKVLLFLAFGIFVVSYILALLRWEMLLRALKIHLPLKRVIISFSGGIFFSLFLPSTLGGDFMRSLDLAVHTKRPKEVIATVLLDRLSGYIGLVCLALLSLIFGWRFIQDKSVLWAVFIITSILILTLLVLFNKSVYSKVNKLLHSPGAGKLRESIKNLHQEIHYFRNHKKVIVNNLIFSIFIQAAFPLSFFTIALSLGLKTNILYFFIFLPIIGTVTLLPISIGGLGLREAMTVFFFGKVNVAKNLAFAMSLINFLFILICGSIGGLIYVLTLHHRRIQRDKPSSVQSHA